jgi:hypothetical protein
VIATIPIQSLPRKGGNGHPPAAPRRQQPRTAPGRRAPAVYRRRRLAAFGVLAAAVLASVAGVEAAAGSPTGLGSSEDVAVHVVVVRPGDTLWSIAAASRPRGDVRILVDELAAEVHGRALQVGERITVP